MSTRLRVLGRHLACQNGPRSSSDSVQLQLNRQLTSGNAAQREKLVETSTRRILSLFENYGNSDYIGEPMSITEHSVQTAAACAKANETKEAELSCLLHDIGHLLGLEAGFEPGMGGCGTPDHEIIGAEFLKDLGFSDAVGFLARHHVDAKRYLCTRKPGYYDTLTDASKTTLKFQGGPMSEEECAEMEKNPLWELVIRMRYYDEAGKDPTVKEKKVVEYLDELKMNLLNSQNGSPYATSYVLSREQLRRWDQDGYLIIRNALSAGTVERLNTITEEVANLPKTQNYSYPWMVHHEIVQHDGKERLNICRVENFVNYHAEWNKICFDLILPIVSQAYREEAVLFKDKMNFKGPGGGGFLLHQDATAYATEELASRHISVMVAIDQATNDNGPLLVTPGRHTEGIFANEAGVVNQDIHDTMEFVPVLVNPGDIVLFDSFLPHKSEGNNSNGWRRLAYLTFNKLSEGNLHADYYNKKIQLMKEGKAGSISINNDFAGNVV